MTQFQLTLHARRKEACLMVYTSDGFDAAISKGDWLADQDRSAAQQDCISSELALV